MRMNRLRKNRYRVRGISGVGTGNRGEVERGLGGERK